METQYKLYDSVELTQDMMSEGGLGLCEPALLREGQRGVIVEIYEKPMLGFEVEFFDDAGDTVALMTLTAHDLRPFRGNRKES